MHMGLKGELLPLHVIFWIVKNAMDSWYLQKFFVTEGTENSFPAGRSMES